MKHIELGVEAVYGLFAAGVTGAVIVWGAVSANTARIDGMESAVQRIDENTQWLVRRELSEQEAPSPNE